MMFVKKGILKSSNTRDTLILVILVVIIKIICTKIVTTVHYHFLVKLLKLILNLYVKQTTKQQYLLSIIKG